jgi:hypothetical protein
MQVELRRAREEAHSAKQRAVGCSRPAIRSPHLSVLHCAFRCLPMLCAHCIRRCLRSSLCPALVLAASVLPLLPPLSSRAAALVAGWWLARGEQASWAAITMVQAIR